MVIMRKTEHTDEVPTLEQIAEWQNPDHWDWENAYRGTAAPDARLILELSFSGDEIQLLGAAARAQNVDIAGYITDLALTTAKHNQRT